MIDAPARPYLTQFAVGWLDVPGIVDGTALKNSRFAVPHKIGVKTTQAFVHDRAFQPGGLPVASAIHRDIDALDLAAPAPGQPGDAVKAFVQQHLPAAGRGDDAFDFLGAAVLAMCAVRHQIDIVNCLVFGGIRHVAQLNAAQVLDPAHALYAGHDQAQRVAVFGSQHFTVLPIRHQHFTTHDQTHGNGARHAGAIGTLGQHKSCALEICAAQFQQSAQRHPRELAAAEHAVGVLHCGHSGVAPLHAGVGTALDEMHAADTGQAHQLIHVEHHGAFEHAGVRTIDHQPVF